MQLWQNGNKIETYSGSNEYEPLKNYVTDKAKSLKLSTEIEELEGEQEEEEDEQELEEIQEEEDVPEDDNQDEQVQLELPNPEGISVNLDAIKMKEISAGSVPWFIKFYSPSCPHCKVLAPTWVELASQFRDQLNIGEVNCQVLRGRIFILIKSFYFTNMLIDVCAEYGIEGFPTLKMYGHGEVVKYSGDRSLASFVAFANANSG